MTRPHIVHQLIDAALTGMASVAEGTSADEVFSAQITMAHRAVHCAIATGIKRAELRQLLGVIMLECAEDTVQ